MRATGRDIVEIFGFAPDDLSEEANKHWASHRCPFVDKTCSKTNHDQSVIYGTCSVTVGSEGTKEVIVCPKRLYADQYKVLAEVAAATWMVPVPTNNLIRTLVLTL